MRGSPAIFPPNSQRLTIIQEGIIFIYINIFMQVMDMLNAEIIDLYKKFRLMTYRELFGHQP